MSRRRRGDESSEEEEDDSDSDLWEGDGGAEGDEDDDDDALFDADDDDEEAEEEEKKKKEKKKPRRRRSKKVEESSEEGEEEESSSEEEDDSDDDDDDDDESSEESDGWGEDMMGSTAEERARVHALTALEREALLADRYDKRRAAQQRRAARREMRERRRQGRKGKKKGTKRRASRLDDYDDSRAKRSRSSKAATEARSKNSALADISMRRQQRQRSRLDETGADEESDGDARGARGASDDSHDDSDDGGDSSGSDRGGRRGRGGVRRRRRRRRDDDDDDGSEFEGSDDGKGRPRRPRTPTFERNDEPQLDDVKKLQIRRNALLKIADEPYFDAVVPHMFVRLATGANSRGITVYRCCQVVRAETYDKPYAFEGRQLTKGLLLRWGKAEKRWKLVAASNQSITAAEFQDWRSQTQSPPSRQLLEYRFHEAEKARKNFVYKPEHVQAMVERRARQSLHQVNVAQRRMELQRKIGLHHERGQAEEARPFERELEKLDEFVDAQKRRKETEQRKAEEDEDPNGETSSKKKKKARSVAELNKRIQEANLEVEREAQRQALRERRAGKAKAKNPFQRRATQPTLAIGGGPAEARRKEEEKAAAAAAAGDAKGDDAAAAAGSSQENAMELDGTGGGEDDAEFGHDAVEYEGAPAAADGARDEAWEELKKIYSSVRVFVDANARPAPPAVLPPPPSTKAYTKIYTLDEYEQRVQAAEGL